MHVCSFSSSRIIQIYCLSHAPASTTLQPECHASTNMRPQTLSSTTCGSHVPIRQRRVLRTYPAGCTTPAAQRRHRVLARCAVRCEPPATATGAAAVKSTSQTTHTYPAPTHSQAVPSARFENITTAAAQRWHQRKLANTADGRREAEGRREAAFVAKR